MDLLGLAQLFTSGGMGQQNTGFGNQPFGGFANSGVIGLVLQMIQSYPGGLPALIQLFEQSGLAEQAQSWISTNANQPVTGAQMQQALGSQIQTIAQQTSVPHTDVANSIASLLPQLIDKLTPQGSLPQNHDAVSQALDMLKSKLAA